MLIYLGHDRYATVDVADWKLVKKFSWYATRAPWSRTWYAVTKVGRLSIYMHRLILGTEAEGKLVDHRDFNGLNNHRSNLRVCTPSQSSCNQQRTKSVTGFKGVQIDKRGKEYRYFALVTVNGKRHYKGSFASAAEAAIAYNRLATQYHGEFACLNKVR